MFLYVRVPGKDIINGRVDLKLDFIVVALGTRKGAREYLIRITIATAHPIIPCVFLSL